MKTILIVDDEPDILRVMGSRLTQAGYTVCTAASGADALARLDDLAPDLILLDICMPDMDGREVVAKMRSNPALSSVPVIFLTALDSTDDKVTGLATGVNDYIVKPVDSRELVARIEATLRLSDRYAELSQQDELTGLHNYNFFEKQFTQMFAVARRYGRVFSVLVIDVNKLKILNDTRGHLCGNFVLQEISRYLVQSLRTVDVVARYGGDEFAVILPETDTAQATELTARLRQSLGKLTLTYRGAALQTGVSIGVATYEPDMENKAALFNAADRDMYQQKRGAS